MAERGGSMGWGLVGLGRHAGRFIAPAIRRSSRSVLAAVYSRDMHRARLFARDHGGPTAYDDLEAMCADPQVAAVYICSPNAAHGEQVLSAARAGKDILCEKPLANTVEDCLRMTDACRRAGVRLGVGFHLRHNPAHILVKEMVAAGKIGGHRFAEVQYMHVTSGAAAKLKQPPWRLDHRSAGGGSFVGTGVHAVDLLRFILMREITHVFAFADPEWQRTRRERLVQASLLMEDGTVASLAAGNMQYPVNQIVLYGESATVRCAGSIGNYGGGRIELMNAEGTSVTEVDPCDVYLREIDAFVECLLSNTVPDAAGHDGLQAARVTAGIYESIQTGRMVEIPACP